MTAVTTSTVLLRTVVGWPPGSRYSSEAWLEITAPGGLAKAVVATIIDIKNANIRPHMTALRLFQICLGGNKCSPRGIGCTGHRPPRPGGPDRQATRRRLPLRAARHLNTLRSPFSTVMVRQSTAYRFGIRTWKVIVNDVPNATVIARLTLPTTRLAPSSEQPSVSPSDASALQKPPVLNDTS